MMTRQQHKAKALELQETVIEMMEAFQRNIQRYPHRPTNAEAQTELLGIIVAQNTTLLHAVMASWADERPVFPGLPG